MPPSLFMLFRACSFDPDGFADPYATIFFKTSDILVGVLGQLPTGDISPLDKNKAQILPTRTTIPRTTPPTGPQQTCKSIDQDQYLPEGELSWRGVVRIRLACGLFYFMCMANRGDCHLVMGSLFLYKQLGEIFGIVFPGFQK